MRIALLSGGKDSLYAAMQHWPPDLGLVLIYEFPRPSPHLVNLKHTLETLTLTGVPVVVARLPRGREMEATVELLRRLGATELVAGDVYIEDHLRYMERVAEEAGARLREPLWGMDPEELLHRIMESGIKPLVIGAEERLSSVVGSEITPGNLEWFKAEARRAGADPLGERGEYHTLVLDSPVHKEPYPKPEPAETIKAGGYLVLRLK